MTPKDKVLTIDQMILLLQGVRASGIGNLPIMATCCQTDVAHEVGVGYIYLPPIGKLAGTEYDIGPKVRNTDKGQALVLRTDDDYVSFVEDEEVEDAE